VSRVLDLDGQGDDSVASEAGGAPGGALVGTLSPSTSSITWWPLLVPLVIVLVGAWQYRWVDEDAFINFRIIDNLLAGHGLVFNVGERVEVDSDPLWLFTLTGLHEILRFISLEWLSVLLGLVCTGAGFVSGGRAVQHLFAEREGSATILPVGLLIVSVVAGVWEFSTSGLEMSMVFLWIGSSYLLLVRYARWRRRALLVAFVMGLGTLIRPELALMTVVFLAALLWVMAAPDHRTRRAWVLRAAAALACALALPVLFELFRMGYYGLLVPNTGLAKAGGSAWWSQGFTYLWNFVSPYTLWLPLACCAPLLALPLRRWWRRGDRVGAVLLVVPLAAGLVDVLYVVHLGGDYMHARLLLPGFFAVCLPIAVPLQRRSVPMALPLLVIAVWSVVCAGWLRFVPPPVTSLNPQTVFISNERNSWISATGNQHPITAADYAKALSGQAGSYLARQADHVPAGRQEMLIVTDPFAPIGSALRGPASSHLPFTLVVNVPAIGVIGYLAGPKVYLFDSYSLANPIGSHTVITHHARPGHEKYIGPAWMVARFGVPGAIFRVGNGDQLAPAEIRSARRALACAPLSSYLQAITSPLTPSRFFSDMAHSFGYSTFSFSAQPSQAAGQLCGPPATGASS
jgi:arabinofuranosyltransferase